MFVFFKKKKQPFIQFTKVLDCWSFSSFKAFSFFFEKYIIYKLQEYYKAKIYGLINYSENAAYYNTTPRISTKEGKKKSNTHINKKCTTYKQFKTKLSLPLPTPFINVSSQTSKIESHANKT